MNGATKWGNVTNDWPMERVRTWDVPPFCSWPKMKGCLYTCFFFKATSGEFVGPLLVTPPIKGYNLCNLCPPQFYSLFSAISKVCNSTYNW